MDDMTTIRVRKRAAVLEPICEYLLLYGLSGANLRALARAAQTSDRMLLYYFVDKDDLITAALERLAERLSTLLEERTPDELLPPDVMTEAIWSAIREPNLWVFMILFIEVVVHAARRGEPFMSLAKTISENFRNWLADHILVEDKATRAIQAEQILATIDGRVLLRLAEQKGAAP